MLVPEFPVAWRLYLNAAIAMYLKVDWIAPSPPHAADHTPVQVHPVSGKKGRKKHMGVETQTRG